MNMKKLVLLKSEMLKNQRFLAHRKGVSRIPLGFSNFPLGKKTIVYFSMFLLSVSLVFGASLSRDMPGRVSPGEEVEVTFSISGMDVGEEAGISEVIAEGITVKEQKVTGAEGTAKYELVGRNHKWGFKASSSSCSVTYKFDAPSEVGSYDFDAVYALPPANIDNIKSTLTVRVITCGDGFCEGDENSDNCESDCPKPAPPAEEEAKKVNVGLIIIVAIVVIGLIIYFVVSKKKKPELPV